MLEQYQKKQHFWEEPQQDHQRSYNNFSNWCLRRLQALYEYMFRCNLLTGTIVFFGQRPPATGQRPPDTGHRPTAHRPPPTGHRPPPATGQRSPAHRPTGQRSPAHRPPATGHRPPATGQRSPASGHRPTSDHTGSAGYAFMYSLRSTLLYSWTAQTFVPDNVWLKT